MALPTIVTKFGRDALVRQQGNKEFVQESLTLLSPDVVKWEDDFEGDIHVPAAGTNRLGYLGYMSFTDGTGGSVAAYPATAGAHGTIELVTGTTDDGYSALSRRLQWYGQYGACMMVILKMSAITGVKVEVGFTDATGTDNGAATDSGAVNVLATPTYTATDLAVWLFDTDDTGNVGWQACAVANGTGITKVEPTVIGNYDGDNDPNADIYEALLVATRGTTARFMRGDMVNASGTDNAKQLTWTYDSGWQASALTATVALAPWIFAQVRGTTSRTITVDYLKVWQYRYTSI